jgi:alanine-glyoxylate transaminase/serine-glyoxylate transaminase/serine-pyruvate transaminase
VTEKLSVRFRCAKELDVVLYLKSSGVLMGLAHLMVFKKAMQVWEKQKTPVPNYYADWRNFTHNESLRRRDPALVFWDNVNFVVALETSLKIICKEGIEKKVEETSKISKSI